MSRGGEQAFEHVVDELAAAGDLFVAAVRHDLEAVDAVRARAGVDWRDVSWTLALLLRGAYAGEAPTRALLAGLLEDG